MNDFTDCFSTSSLISRLLYKSNALLFLVFFDLYLKSKQICLLVLFQACTGIDNIAEAITLLELNNWDLVVRCI